MPQPPPLHLLSSTAGNSPRAYLIAGRRLDTDLSLPVLERFALSVPAAVSWPPRSPRPSRAGRVSVYRGPGWVGGRLAEVSCGRTGAIYDVIVPGLPLLLVERGGCVLAPESAAGVKVSPALVEALLGPGLVLALALDGVFTLHAAAVSADGRAALFLGESGAGKSTLARALAAAGAAARIADDVLLGGGGGGGAGGGAAARFPRGGRGFAGGGGRPVALPHFPQLKLASGEQYGAERPPRVSVRVVYLLDGSEGWSEAVRIEAMGERDALLTVAAHTVAARLFDAALLARHLAFCGEVAAAAPLRRLRFRKRLEALPALGAAVRDDIARLP